MFSSILGDLLALNFADRYSNAFMQGVIWIFGANPERHSGRNDQKILEELQGEHRKGSINRLA